jgi:phenylpropionate dioxygenase-like ring-hydroxylating dioxygenase large terminal subunit
VACRGAGHIAVRVAGQGFARYHENVFTDFSNVWTPVTLAQRLTHRAPLAVELASEKLVFFRAQDGTPVGLIDRCPHRGVALSLGVVRDGCLECPFHAWQFGPDGACVRVPLNPDAKRELLSATSIPVREAGGLLWAFTAPGKSAPFEPTLPPTLVASGLARTFLEVEWKAHWTRAMENMLDSPHVPFLHKKTIGRFVRPFLKPESRMDVDWEETSYGGKTTAVIDGNAAHDAGLLEFYRPNMMVLTIPMPGQTFRMHVGCVPIDSRRVRMIIVGARSFARWRILNPFFNWSNRRIANEDQAVVESSFPTEIPPANQERSVRTDQATLQFRKYYFASLKNSVAEVPTPNVLRAVNPFAGERETALLTKRPL